MKAMMPTQLWNEYMSGKPWTRWKTNTALRETQAKMSAAVCRGGVHQLHRLLVDVPKDPKEQDSFGNKKDMLCDNTFFKAMHIKFVVFNYKITTVRHQCYKTKTVNISF